MRLAERIALVRAESATGDACRTVHRHAAEVLGLDPAGVGVIDPAGAKVDRFLDRETTEAWVPADTVRFAVLTDEAPVVIERRRVLDVGVETVDGHLLVSFTADVGPTDEPVAGRAELLTIATAALAGLARAALDRATARVTARVQFGQPLASFQVVRHRLADALIDVEACEHAAAEAAAAIDAGETEALAIARLAKLTANLAAERVVAACHQVCGGAGYLEDGGLGPITRSVVAVSSGVGPSAALRQAISEHVTVRRPAPGR